MRESVRFAVSRSSRRPLRFLSLLLLGIALLGLSFGAGQALASSVSGVVTDAVSGAPIANAYVYAWYDTGGFYTSTYTDSTGAYTLYLYNGNWKLSFQANLYVTQYFNDKPDFASADLITTSDDQPTLTGYDAQLQRQHQGHVVGTVHDAASGQPIAGVMVTACDSDWNGVSYVYTGADGKYDMAVTPGTYGIVFDDYGYDRVYYNDASSPADATLLTLNNGDVQTADASLTPEPATVTGSATDVDGVRLPGIQLQVLSAADGHVFHSATTGPDGTCVIDVTDLIGQQVKLRLHDPSGVFADNYYNTLVTGAPSFSDALAFAPQAASTYFCGPLLYNARGGEIKGRTLDVAGHPVAGVTVSLYDPAFPQYGVQTVSDAKGNYDLTGLHVSNATKFTVGFDQPDYVSQYYNAKYNMNDANLVPVAPGKSVTVNSSIFKHWCVIQGTLTDPAGPVGNVLVSIYGQTGSVVATTSTSSTGTYSVGNLAPGSYRVGFHDPRNDAGELPADQDQFYSGATTLQKATVLKPDGLNAYAKTANATLKPVGGIRVDLYSGASSVPLTGLKVTLYNARGTAVATTTGHANGHYVFRSLAAGTYFLGCTDPSGVYKAQFYNKASSLKKATPVVLTRSAPTVLLQMTLLFANT